jgi:hypothetical protein
MAPFGVSKRRRKVKHRFTSGSILTLLFALLFSFGFALAEEDPQPPQEEAALTVDIKPGSCLNPVNVKSKGVIPIAVLGPMDPPLEQGNTPAVSFSVEVAGISFPWSPKYVKVGYDDVTAPDGDCAVEDPDDNLDLLLKVRIQELVTAVKAALEGENVALTNGQEVKLTVTVGTAQGEDTLTLRGVKKAPKQKPVKQ